MVFENEKQLTRLSPWGGHHRTASFNQSGKNTIIELNIEIWHHKNIEYKNETNIVKKMELSTLQE